MLNTPTLLMANFMVASLFAVCLGLVSRRERAEGLWQWAAAMASLAACMLLLMFRGRTTDWLAIGAPALLLCATFAQMLDSVARFQQRPAPAWMVWGPLPLTALFSLALVNGLRPGLLPTGLLLVTQLLLVLVSLRRGWQAVPGYGKHFLAMGMLLFTLNMLARPVLLLLGYVNPTVPLASDAIQAAAFLSTMAGVILSGLGVLVMAKDRTDEHNRALALMDELTGLYNRRHTQQTLVRQLAQARRAQRPLAVLMLDVDHFKRVNDTYGHPTGDQVLRELALRILERLRAQDLAGRWGGEEFLVVLPDTDARGAQALAGQLILAIEGRPFLAANGKPLRLTASVGVHVLPAGEAGERDDMISAADRALYLAKERGRNRVEVL